MRNKIAKQLRRNAKEDCADFTPTSIIEKVVGVRTYRFTPAEQVRLNIKRNTRRKKADYMRLNKSLRTVFNASA